MSKTSNYLIPEFQIELSDGSKVTAKCSFATLIAYENLTGASVLSLKLKSASEMVKFLACAIYGDSAIEHLAELSQKLSPEHFKVVFETVNKCFPSKEATEESEDEEVSEEEELGKEKP